MEYLTEEELRQKIEETNDYFLAYGYIRRLEELENKNKEENNGKQV